MRKLIIAGLLLVATAALAQPSADTPLAREWDDHLRGKRLTQLSSYSSGTAGGYNARQVAYLCADGRFLYASSSSVGVYGDTGGMGSAGGTEEHTGRWRVVSAGEIAAVEVHIDGGESGYLRRFTRRELSRRRQQSVPTGATIGSEARTSIREYSR